MLNLSNPLQTALTILTLLPAKAVKRGVVGMLSETAREPDEAELDTMLDQLVSYAVYGDYTSPEVREIEEWLTGHQTEGEHT